MAERPSAKAAAYQRMKERFAEAQVALAAVEAAHREGRFRDVEHDALVSAVNAVSRAADEFRRVAGRASEDGGAPGAGTLWVRAAEAEKVENERRERP